MNTNKTEYSSTPDNGRVYNSRRRRSGKPKRNIQNRLFTGILIVCVCLIAVIFFVYIAGAGEHGVQAQPYSGQDYNGESAAQFVSEPAALEEDPQASSANDMFTQRDLTQTADLSDAVYHTVTDGDAYHITQEGVYVLSGSASNAVIYVEAAAEDKVQLVLDGLTVNNDSFPCIYVTGADKVFITTANDSFLTVSNAFMADGDTNTDGVIFSRSDVVLNGTAALTISSSENGVVSKDDLKITGGTYDITAAAKALEANDSICIADGTLYLNAGTDGIHAENDEDDSLGYIYICGGDFNIQAGDDGIHAVSFVQIDKGTFQISAGEGIEGTYVQINDGTIGIQASDDGINAARKSTSYTTALEINGGTITIVMANGDTDGLDSNGNLFINGGTVDITARSAVDYDGVGEMNGGTLIVNGQQMTALPNQMMGGGGSRGESAGGRGW